MKSRVRQAGALILLASCFGALGCSEEDKGVRAVRVGESSRPPAAKQAAQPPYHAVSRTSHSKQLANSIGMEFVWIPAGSFLMGSPAGEKTSPHEMQHQVRLTKSFYMAVNLVTQQQWQRVMRNNPSEFRDAPGLPVEQVTWEDCQNFCNKLSELDAKAYRLPTEAEWEYCCRAGTTTAFSFGDHISAEKANCCVQPTLKPPEKTTPVGTFPANPWGLCDMHGNLWQWCQDWFDEYTEGLTVDPHGPATGAFRVLRGGSWCNTPDLCRSANRASSAPDQRSAIVGFRVCFDAD
jgi:formylglycine-generating enzyme required for sulfatase activity